MGLMLTTILRLWFKKDLQGIDPECVRFLY